MQAAKSGEESGEDASSLAARAFAKLEPARRLIEEINSWTSCFPGKEIL